jgi:ribosomal protein S1
VRRLFCYFIVLLFLSNSTGGGLAADRAPAKDGGPGSEKKAADKKAKTTKPARPQRLKGEITALDAGAGTVTVKSTAGEKSFLTQDAAKDSLEVLEVGERVRVMYLEKDGKSVATSLRRIKARNPSREDKQKKPKTKPATQSSGVIGGHLA